MKRKGIKNPKCGIWYNAQKTFWDTEELLDIVVLCGGNLEIGDTWNLLDVDEEDDFYDYWTKIPNPDNIRK